MILKMMVRSFALCLVISLVACGSKTEIASPSCEDLATANARGKLSESELADLAAKCPRAGEFKPSPQKSY